MVKGLPSGECDFCAELHPPWSPPLNPLLPFPCSVPFKLPSPPDAPPPLFHPGQSFFTHTHTHIHTSLSVSPNAPLTPPRQAKAHLTIFRAPLPIKGSQSSRGPVHARDRKFESKRAGTSISSA
jgi:hypothetical protein